MNPYGLEWWLALVYNAKLPILAKASSRYIVGCLNYMPYKQGELAIFYMQFTNELMEKLLGGVITFFIEYCKVFFNEDYEEAQWNYDGFFSITG